MAARRLHGLIYTTIAFCCLVIVVCGVALGTNEWFSSQGFPLSTTVTDPNNSLHIKVTYGLFKGKKIKYGGTERHYELNVVCQASDAKCMYSCGTTAKLRKTELSLILGEGDIPNNSDAAYCQESDGEGGTKQMTSRQETGSESKADMIFLNFGLYFMTIAFLAIAIAFAFLAGALALYNTYRTPIQPMLSVFGLYIWNGISAAAVTLAMIMWIVVYVTQLNKNAGISDTLVGNYTSEGQGSLGISFWILLLGILFSLANIGILRYRSWKIIQMEAKNVRVMTEKLDNGDILLF